MRSTPSTDARPAPSPLARHWPNLPRELVYLNHGSFGACPEPVLAAQRDLRDRMEADGVRWMVSDIWHLIDAARSRLAPVVNCAPADLVLVPNATTAVATAIENWAECGWIKPGDELLVNSHEYSACISIFKRVAQRTGARVVCARLPFPGGPGEALTQSEYEDAVVDALVGKVNERTKLCLLSHVTSPTALVLPAERIVRALRERGVETLLDGAHGVGFHDIDIDGIGAAFYTANAHKWVCGPKGSAFLHVRQDIRERMEQIKPGGFRPLVLSIYAHTQPAAARYAGGDDRSRFHLDFDYVGTDDATPRMAIRHALDFMDDLGDELAEANPALPGKLAGVMQHNRELALRGRDLLIHALGGGYSPAPDAMLGPLVTILLPQQPEPVRKWAAAQPTRYADCLQDRLLENHGIQVPIWSVPPDGSVVNCEETGMTLHAACAGAASVGCGSGCGSGAGPAGARFVRISAQVYNTPEQYRYLGECLKEELARERHAVGC